MSVFFITGINGFIGSHIAEQLIKEGHKVRGLIRSTSDVSFIKGLDIDLYYGDILDRESIKSGMEGVDIVIHAAALASDWGRFEKFYKVNFIGSQNVAISCVDMKVKRLVYISSAAICGFQNKRHINEDSEFKNTPYPYCQTKKMTEEWLFPYCKKEGLELVVIRPGNVFGVNDHTFIEGYLQALEQRKIGFINGGKYRTCPVFVDNLVDAIIKASFSSKANGEVFIITDGLDIDWKTFTRTFCDYLQIPKPKFSIPYWFAYFLSVLSELLYKLFNSKTAPILTRYRVQNVGRDYHFSIKKAENILGYKPIISFESAVKKTVMWYKNKKAR